MSENVFILGGEQSDFERNWTKEGKSFLGMMRETTEDAFDAVGVTYSDISALKQENRIEFFVGNFAAEQYIRQGHLGAFFTEIDTVFEGIPGARYEAACASGSTAIDAAINKILSKEIDVAVVLGIEMMKSVDAVTGGDFLGTAAYYEKEAKGIEFPFPNLFSRLADIIIEKHKFPEQIFMDALAEIAHKNYSNAKRNTKAKTRNWYMSKEHASCRNVGTNMEVGGRLCITDCSQVADGAAMVILSSHSYAAEFAAKRNRSLKAIPVIKGWGCKVAPVLFSQKKVEALQGKFVLPWTRSAVELAYKKAGLGVDKIDFFETHDCFTSSEFAAISAFGITDPGDEISAIESGVIGFKGKKPVNPSGGLIGVGHPVGATGVRMILDLYKQVASKAGAYQVEGAKNGCMLNIGGSATTNYVFVVGRDD